jgi:hypothetical protein
VSWLACPHARSLSLSLTLMLDMHASAGGLGCTFAAMGNLSKACSRVRLVSSTQRSRGSTRCLEQVVATGTTKAPALQGLVHGCRREVGELCVHRQHVRASVERCGSLYTDFLRGGHRHDVLGKLARFPGTAVTHRSEVSHLVCPVRPCPSCFGCGTRCRTRATCCPRASESSPADAPWCG